MSGPLVPPKGKKRRIGYSPGEIPSDHTLYKGLIYSIPLTFGSSTFPFSLPPPKTGSPEP